MTISHCLQGLGTHFWPFQADAHDQVHLNSYCILYYVMEIQHLRSSIQQHCNDLVFEDSWKSASAVDTCARASSKRLCPWSCRWICVSWQQAFSSSFPHEIEIKVKSRVEPADRLFPSMLNPGIGKKCNKKKHFKCHTLSNSFKAPFCYCSRLNI